MSTETTVSDGFAFEFSKSQSSTTTVQTTLSQSIQVSVPPFSNITVDMVLASQVRGIDRLLIALTPPSQNDVSIPFVAQLYASAYDWMANSGAPSQQQIADILYAGGFEGRIINYNAANHTLLIENKGTLRAAIATSVNVQLVCTPLPGALSFTLIFTPLHTLHHRPRSQLPAAARGHPAARRGFQRNCPDPASHEIGPTARCPGPCRLRGERHLHPAPAEPPHVIDSNNVYSWCNRTITRAIFEKLFVTNTQSCFVGWEGGQCCLQSRHPGVQRRVGVPCHQIALVLPQHLEQLTNIGTLVINMTSYLRCPVVNSCNAPTYAL